MIAILEACHYSDPCSKS